MRFLDDKERLVAQAIAALADGNPFLPQRVELERQALGPGFSAHAPVWHADADLATAGPNAAALRAVVERLAGELRRRLVAGCDATPEDIALYQGVVEYVLFQRYEDDWYALLIANSPGGAPPNAAGLFGRFAEDVEHFFAVPGRNLGIDWDAAHLFALGFQVRRAFHHIFRQIFGSSMPVAELRAAVWQSIFTHDAGRYRRVLYRRMTDIPTLIVGESGSGKELVARAIALSRFIPFDVRGGAFAANCAGAVQAVNLSALTPTLIESELFGHRRGAFTGADEDRGGWLESCGAYGSVFLDEIGELDLAVQVKLLRVLQSRVFQRIGETTPRVFAGKVIAATNRDLDREIAAGRFRLDLYYRLCADLVRTPTLREQLRDAPGDLTTLIVIVARRVVGDEGDEAARLAAEVEHWIAEHLPREYAWPGNVRELEQCVRNVVIRGSYQPRASSDDAAHTLAEGIRRVTFTAEQLLQRYCAIAYAATGNYQEAARRLGLDRRTVRTKLAAGSDRATDRNDED